MKKNALILAKAAKILKTPLVLTSGMEDQAPGPAAERAGDYPADRIRGPHQARRHRQHHG
jgi:hypothetical protein